MYLQLCGVHIIDMNYVCTIMCDCDCVWYAVAKWYEAGLCDREVAGSTPASGCCVPTPTQRAIPPGSVNEDLIRGLLPIYTPVSSPSPTNAKSYPALPLPLFLFPSVSFVSLRLIV